MARALVVGTLMTLCTSAARAQEEDDGPRRLTAGLRIGGTPAGTTQGLYVGVAGEMRTRTTLGLARLELGVVSVGRDRTQVGPTGQVELARRVRTQAILALLSAGPRLPFGESGISLHPALGVGVAQLRVTPIDSVASRPGPISLALTVTLLGEGAWSVDYGWYTIGGIGANDARPTFLRVGWRW